VLLLLATAATAPAQFPALGERVSLEKVAIEPENVAIGGQATLVVTVVIEEGWHIYSLERKEFSLPTTFKLLTEGVSIAGPIKEPKPSVHEEEWGSTFYHEGQPVFRIPIAFDPGLEGRVTVRVEMGYQACDATGCLEPTTVTGKAAVTLAAAGAASTAPTTGLAVDEVSLRRLIESAMEDKVSDLNDDISDKFEALIERLSPILPALPEFLPAPPDWNLGDLKLEILDSQIRANEKARIRVTFTTPERAHIAGVDDVYADFGPSERIREIETIAVESSEDGLSHQIDFEVQAAQLARSGQEDANLTVAVPLSQEGLNFEKEAGPLALSLDFGLPSIWAWVLKAALAALLALLTPCVFPMIPVTVSYFTKQAEKEHKNPLMLPLVYVVGIVVSFVVIGAGVTALVGSSGVQILATNGWIQGFFGLLFVVFSISLFGVFTLRPPSFLMAKAGSVQGKGGMLGTLGMGLLFSLTSFTCTAPLVGAILVDAAQSGEWQFPIVGMFVFSLVLAIPFFFLSLFPKVLSGMPKSGGWMNSVKVTLGFLELAFALKFIGAMDAYFGWGIFTRTSILWLWTLIFALNG
ncbi:MAG: hypothetical protein KDB53_09940, partial [Planctomycetes bacterium]|nr:hypothetical protein [Planctomycetota bacterium]